MMLHSSHLTHAWWYTTLCAILHHASFLLLNHGWDNVPSRNVFRDCGIKAFSVSPFACAKIDHSGFTYLHSKCTWSTVIRFPHLHLSVSCVWREIWWATRHAWLRVLSEGIRLTLIHANLLTLITICVLRREPRSGLSAACTSRVSTLL